MFLLLEDLSTRITISIDFSIDVTVNESFQIFQLGHPINDEHTTREDAVSSTYVLMKLYHATVGHGSVMPSIMPA